MTLSVAAHPLDGLNCPPFGSGTGRRYSGQVVGYSDSGFPYQAFDYDCSTYSDYGSVATLRIPYPLPPFFASLPSNPRPGIVGLQVPNDAGLLLVTEEEEYGWAMVESVLPAFREFARRRPLDVAVDGDSLTVVRVPTGPPSIHAYMNDLSIIAQAIAAAPALQRFQRPKPPGMSFYRRPGWAYVPRDDRLLATAPVTWDGDEHQALDVVAAAPDRGLQTLGFRHQYQVMRYDGNSRTPHTEEEYVVQTALPFRFGRVAMDWRGFAQPLIFHMAAFDDQHTVYADDRPFATEVFRPLLPFLVEMGPPPFAIQDQFLWMRPQQPPTEEIVAWCQAFAVEFFSQVSDKVWNHLGQSQNPLPRSLR